MVKNRKKNVDVLLGLQWGDEGKGKIVDVLTPGYNIIARFQGGPNAGHTLEFDNRKIILHTIPSGIFHESTLNLIGNGVVIDPVVFKGEVQRLDLAKDIILNSILISKKAHLILPTHRLLDSVYEQSRGKNKIGSTLKGIGPAYTDKVARLGIRVGHISQKDFQNRYDTLKQTHFKHAASYDSLDKFRLEGMDFESYEKLWFESLELLSEMPLIDSEVFVNNSLNNGLNLLAEGAQGTLLDIDFGSYPFVTSSNTITAGACTGLGISPSRIEEVIGVFKAYCTRVGSGPFPTEIFHEKGETFRKKGNEFGSTTGRPRRCGWLDLAALKYAIMINGVDKLIITKADVLNSFKDIKVCTKYKIRNQYFDYIPFNIGDKDLEPVYKTLKGWKKSLENVDSFAQAPKELTDYVKYIEDYVETPVWLISSGPKRDQVIKR